MRSEKQFAVEELKNKLDWAATIVVTQYGGLSAEQMNDLRDRLYGQSANYMVVKNRLLKIAAREAGKEQLNEFLEGPVGIVFGPESYGGMLKELMKFNGENKLPELLGGYVEEQYLAARDMQSVALLPSKEELQAKLLAGLQAPIRGLVSVLGQRLSSFVRVLDAIAKKKAEQDGPGKPASESAKETKGEVEKKAKAGPVEEAKEEVKTGPAESAAKTEDSEEAKDKAGEEAKEETVEDAKKRTGATLIENIKNINEEK